MPDKIGFNEIHRELKKVCAPDEIDHHESDLYVKVKPETTRIIFRYEHIVNVERFIDNFTHTLWYCIYWAYNPELDKEE